MDEQKLAAVLAKGEEAAMKGSADMWRNVIADTTLVLIELGEHVTRASLRQAIEVQLADCSGKFDRARLMGALNALNGRVPRD
jgi:hypothetical protein